METIACNLCQSDAVDWSAVYGDYWELGLTHRLVRCGGCGLVYQNPRPDRGVILARSGVYQDLLRDMRQRLMESVIGRFGIRLLRRGRIPPVDAAGRSILDIGCATGEYLNYLRALGWEVAGIELDPDAVCHAREVFGLEVRAGAAENVLAAFPDRRFDVVSMWHVLEHLDDPAGVLRQVHRVLKPGGWLLVEVPNFGSVWRLLLKGAWFPLECPYHRYHFTPRTLHGLLQRTGFETRGVRGQPAPAETVWSFQMLWNGIRGQSWDGHLAWRPLCVALLYPVERILAWFGFANHMQAVGVRP